MSYKPTGSELQFDRIEVLHHSLIRTSKCERCQWLASN